MPGVLMLAYYYPPLGGIGSQRAQKFARYLPEFGWQPTVVTPRQGRYFLDPLLDDGSAHGVEVRRTRAIDLSGSFRSLAAAGRSEAPSSETTPIPGGAVIGFLRRAIRNWVYVPDGQVGWLPYAIGAGKRAIAERGIRVIFSTSFPVTAHLAAWRLKRQTGLPWIADFRDLWTEHHYDEAQPALRRRLDRRIEAKIFEQADVLATVSDAWAERLRALSGGRKRVEVIRNGFDPEDFARLERQRPARWTITYVGSFYGSKQNPSSFLIALEHLIERRMIPAGDVCFRIVGERDPSVQSLLARHGLAGVAEWTGFVPHAESLRYQVCSSLLLLIVHADAANPGVIPGKVYEYLGARRPILAIVPGHFEVASILRSAGGHAVIPATDVGAIEQCLEDSYRRHRAGEEPDVADARPEVYDRRRGAERLAELFRSLQPPSTRCEGEGP